MCDFARSGFKRSSLRIVWLAAALVSLGQVAACSSTDAPNEPSGGDGGASTDGGDATIALPGDASDAATDASSEAASMATAWAKSFGVSIPHDYANVAVDGEGNIYLAGSFTGTLDFGDASVSSAGTASSLFVASLDVHGQLRWVETYHPESGAASAAVYGNSSIAVDPFGHLFMQGAFTETLDGANTASTFVAAFDMATGAALWSRQFSGFIVEVSGIAADPASPGAIATGYFQGAALDLGGDASLAATYSGGNTLFLVRLSGAADAGGQLEWAYAYGQEDSTSAVVATSGGTYVAGALPFPGSSTADFGGGARTGPSVFLDEVAADGGYVRDRDWVYPSTGSISALAAQPGGGVVMLGGFSGASMTVAGTTLTAPDGGSEIFLVSYDPNLGDASVQATDNPSPPGIPAIAPYSLATDRSGNVLLAGKLVGNDLVVFGAAPASGGSAGSPFITKVGAWIETGGNATTGWAKVAALPAGNPVVVGSFTGTMNLRDSGALSAPADASALFVAVLPP
jgi:hypothetical protein